MDIFSKNGKNILKNYLYLITGGAESTEVVVGKVTRDTLVQDFIAHNHILKYPENLRIIEKNTYK